MENRKPGVSVITPTGGRPWQLKLCAKYLERQTYSGSLQWIVVDDGETRSELPKLRREMLLTQIYPTAKPGVDTLSRNLLTALPEVCYNRILIFEDDDVYRPQYIAAILQGLEHAPLAGESPSLYYYVPGKKYRVMENNGHASLCQTGFREELIPVLESVCHAAPYYIDTRFWNLVPHKHIMRSRFCVGIKGLPGRKGIGMGHDPAGPYWQTDPYLVFLRTWIGEDVELYKEFM